MSEAPLVRFIPETGEIVVRAPWGDVLHRFKVEEFEARDAERSAGELIARWRERLLWTRRSQEEWDRALMAALPLVGYCFDDDQVTVRMERGRIAPSAEWGRFLFRDAAQAEECIRHLERKRWWSADHALALVRVLNETRRDDAEPFFHTGITGIQIGQGVPVPRNPRRKEKPRHA